MTDDPRIDAYIARQQPFAQPILAHLRARVRAACPEAVETIKWGMPFFTIGDRPLANMAGFKAHASFGFWRADRIAPGERLADEGMGQYGRLTSVADLPDDAALDAMIRAAADKARQAPAPRPARTPKVVPPAPDDLAAALAGAPAAKAGFDALPTGARREYVEWVAAAKRPETRAKRLATLLAQCAEGKKLNWKYESC